MVYRHILYIDGDWIIVYNSTPTTYTKNTSLNSILEENVPYFWFSRNENYAGVVRRKGQQVYGYGFNSTQHGDSNTLISSNITSDKVTQVPFPFM